MVAQYKSSKCKENARSSASDYLQAMAKELATIAYSTSLTVMARCFEMAAKEAEQHTETRDRNRGEKKPYRSQRTNTDRQVWCSDDRSTAALMSD